MVSPDRNRGRKRPSRNADPDDSEEEQPRAGPSRKKNRPSGTENGGGRTNPDDGGELDMNFEVQGEYNEDDEIRELGFRPDYQRGSDG
jgi:hypothetical protein